jgi:AraC family transcriptional regulator, transcriptional activator of pobA
MQMKGHQIPILSPSELETHHFGILSEWHPSFSTDQSLFHVNRIESVRDYLKFPLLPHRKTVFDFFFLTKGKSVRSKGLDNYEISTHDFFFLPAYQITTHESMSKDAEGFYCHFDSEILYKNFAKHDISKEFNFLNFVGNPVVKIDNEAFVAIRNILERLEVEYQKEDIYFDLVSCYLLTLFTELKRFVQVTTKVKENSALRIAQQYKNALSQHVYQKQSVAEYADLLAVSPNHLNKCVKTSIGKSAQDLLNEMILLEAKVLLKQTNLSIGEVAFKINKQNPSDFSRFFKAKTGITPKEYKQKD